MITLKENFNKIRLESLKGECLHFHVLKFRVGIGHAQFFGLN